MPAQQAKPTNNSPKEQRLGHQVLRALTARGLRRRRLRAFLPIRPTGCTNGNRCSFVSVDLGAQSRVAGLAGPIPRGGRLWAGIDPFVSVIVWVHPFRRLGCCAPINHEFRWCATCFADMPVRAGVGHHVVEHAPVAEQPG